MGHGIVHNGPTEPIERSRIIAHSGDPDREAIPADSEVVEVVSVRPLSDTDADNVEVTEADAHSVWPFTGRRVR